MATGEKNTGAAERLLTPVQFLKGVGPQRAERLAKLGLQTARDVLFFFPRDYHDYGQLRTIADLEEDCPLSIRGTVEEVELRETGPGRSILGVLVRQPEGFLRAIWFNQPFMQARFRAGQEVLLSGRARFRGGRWEMAHPKLEQVDAESGAEGSPGLQPVYPLTEGVTQHHLRRIVQGVLDEYLDLVDEVLPAPLRREHDLVSIDEAVRQVHFPEDRGRLERARRRLIFQELLVLQLALAVRRREQHDLRRASPLPAGAKIDSRIRRRFEFELTSDQQAAIAEIAADMGRDRPMNRLLQGEVGSGKTVVATYAMLLCVAHGHQAVLMAPTEVLARQHYETLGRWLEQSHVRTGLLVGGLGKGERETLRGAAAAGEIDLVIGTQAILQGELELPKLGLVVIDEQHKFGVLQRAALRQTGLDPHYLVMTATPIPRSIGMTLFGDLDVSTLRQLPPGRQEVHTYLVSPDQEARWWEFVRKKLREGRQAFIVAPLAGESQQEELASAEAEFEALANGELEAFRLDLIYGRMAPAAKQRAMQGFRDGRTQALVSTSVLEVGIDVPNATVMAIQSAERFGLAQLHQLRGRVSRGREPGYCGVFAQPTTDAARERLQAFVDSRDGFHLAEIDFRLRGPGELLGTRQHGLPPLRLADLSRDGELLEEARAAARALIADDAGLATADHDRLRRMVLTRYGRALELGDVG